LRISNRAAGAFHAVALSPPKRARGNPAEPAKDLDTAKAEFKATWEALKARTAPEQLAVACKAMNVRGDG